MDAMQGWTEWSEEKLREIADAEQVAGGMIVGPPAHKDRWYILSRDRGHGHQDFVVCDASMRILPLNEEQAILISLAPDLKARCEQLIGVIDQYQYDAQLRDHLIRNMGAALVLAAARWQGDCDCEYCTRVHNGVAAFLEWERDAAKA